MQWNYWSIHTSNVLYFYILLEYLLTSLYVCMYTCNNSNLVRFSCNFISGEVMKDCLAVHLSYRWSNFRDYIRVTYVCTSILQHAKYLSKSRVFRMKEVGQIEIHITCSTHFSRKFYNVLAN